MPIIQCGANRVAADEPEADDTHVRVVWFGPPQDGRHRKVFEGPLEPAENYDAAVAWAVEMAPQMVFPLYVVPMTAAQVLRTEQAQRASGRMTDQQHGELRREVLSMLLRVLRDCDDPVVRADAHEVLVLMRVVTD
jgi:hypothetical protein